MNHAPYNETITMKGIAMSVGQFFVALAIGCAIVTAYFVYKVVETTFAQLPMM